MNKTLSFIFGLLTFSVAFAAEVSSFDELPAVSAKRLSGSMTLGYDTLANDRGVVLSHSVLGGDGSPIGALKYSYDFGRKGAWSWDGMVYFRDVTSGHRLYGNPTYSDANIQAAGAYETCLMAIGMGAGDISMPELNGMTPTQMLGVLESRGMTAVTADRVNRSAGNGYHVKQANAESEWVLQNGLKYTAEKWNVAFGYSFIRGGVLGVFAKHFRNQGASCLNEVYLRPEWTPTQWLTVGVDVRLSISGIHGWWFLPDVTFKAPLWREGDKVKVAGVCKFAMAATADYFDDTDSACNNGSQSYYIKLSTPWFVDDNWVITPGVGFHWLGKGAIYVNKRSKYALATGNPSFVPFRNFAVVGSLTATYRF